MDHFKHINDSLGHLMDDAVLKIVTAHLETSERLEDTMARLGGNELVVLISGPEGSCNAVKRLVLHVAENLRGLLADPMLLDGHRLHVTPSIGIALVPARGNKPTDLLKHENIVQYRAKDLGRDTI